MNINFHEGELDQPDVIALLDLHLSAMRRFSPPDACHVLPASSLNDRAIRFFSGRDERGLLLCIGALKQLEPSHGEIKSMRAVPDAMGKGVGRMLLDHLVITARGEGMTRLSLETGSTPEFAAAQRLYERAGFRLTGPFGGYPPSPFTTFLTLEI